MCAEQRKLIQAWLAVFALIVVVTLFENFTWVVRIAFACVGVYLIFNWEDLRSIQSRASTVRQVVDSDPLAKYWVVFSCLFEILVCAIFIISGESVDQLLSSYWSLFLAIMFPLLLPALLSQMRLYRELGKRSP